MSKCQLKSIFRDYFIHSIVLPYFSVKGAKRDSQLRIGNGLTIGWPHGLCQDEHLANRKW